MRRVTAALVGRLRSVGESDRGMVAIWTALLMVVLLGMAAISVDIARWYVEAQRLQKTVDAAALAGVVYMPENLPKAEASADAIVKANGWDPNKVDVVKEKGAGGTRFRVTMSSDVTNNFGSVLGLPVTTVTRTAVADFRPPAPLGSPCNVHGNEPWAGSGNPGSALPNPTPANCSSSPEFWATITGPDVFKVQGDRYSVRRCQGGESGCTNGMNDEFDPRGYVITIRVRESLSGSLNVQLYDPAYVETTSQCEDLPGIGQDVLGSNTYTSNARQRYLNNSNPLSASQPSYCTGDDDNYGYRYPASTPFAPSPEYPTLTSFGLLRPNDSLDPFASSSNEIADQICSEQYPGFAKTGNGDAAWLAGVGGSTPGGDATQQLSTNNDITRVFHQWVPFCTIPGPVPAGDYYLRVRTNVPWGNPAAVFSQLGDNTAVLGNSSNRFSVRAVASQPSDNSKVQVSPYTRMPIYANSEASEATFNLIRVLPSSAGQNINFSFFDVGDAAQSGRVSVLSPAESSYQARNCKKDGKQTGTAPDCSISGIKNSSGWDGQAQRMTIPVPAEYTCNVNDPFGCWWRLQVDFTSGAVYDQTTWTASLDGDPVRIVE